MEPLANPERDAALAAATDRIRAILDNGPCTCELCERPPFTVSAFVGEDWEVTPILHRWLSRRTANGPMARAGRSAPARCIIVVNPDNPAKSIERWIAGPCKVHGGQGHTTQSRASAKDRARVDATRGTDPNSNAPLSSDAWVRVRSGAGFKLARVTLARGRANDIDAAATALALALAAAPGTPMQAILNTADAAAYTLPPIAPNSVVRFKGAAVSVDSPEAAAAARRNVKAAAARARRIRADAALAEVA